MKKRSEKWKVAQEMPPLRHSVPGREYDIMQSEAVQWLIRQPEILQILFETVKNKEIAYDPHTGKWAGVDYAD